MGFEPTTSSLGSRAGRDTTHCRASTCDADGQRLADRLADFAKLNPDLAAVVIAWPTLPEPVKAGIAAMIRASVPAPCRHADR